MELSSLDIQKAENGYTVRAGYKGKVSKGDDKDSCMSYDGYKHESKEYVIESKDRLLDLVSDLIQGKMNFKEEIVKALKKDDKKDDEEKKGED